ncbi:MAG: hypothetical protein WKF36_09640 [Candidatus Nitrosocosmicus sp.]
MAVGIKFLLAVWFYEILMVKSYEGEYFIYSCLRISFVKTPLLYSLLILTIVLAMPFSLFTTLELVYPQQRQKKDLWDSVDIQNVNLTLGRPIYTERFEVPGDQRINSNENATSDNNAYSFAGNGTINGMEIAATGSGSTNLGDDGTSSVVGRAFFVSQSGSASYSFEDMASSMGNATQRLGTVFFDANATGDLGFLKAR